MASSSSSSSFSSTITQVRKKYDVFISFRGEDTRYSFTSNLHGDLRRNRIQVFNDEELKRGDEISPSLLKAIEESIISIIVFSEGYASSRWCLEELVQIIDCKKTYSQIVLPVFFQVDPSHVRNQTGIFGNGFSKLVESFNMEKLEKLQMKEQQFKNRVQTWRNAMTEAANLSGYTATYTTSQFGLSEKIVSDILRMLNYLSPVNDKDLVGMHPVINYIITFFLHLEDRFINVHTIGIWGMGGMGKTTIAKTIFNKVRIEFEASYFALNVREKSSSYNSLALLQKDLLSTILDDQHSNLDFTFTKRRLGRKKVIIVFDDVSCLSQIESLIGDLNCLGEGSRIIITTRNKQVLKSCGVDEHNIYKIGGLSHYDALLLFSWYAFWKSCPKIDYDELSNRVVKYAKGVPLALKVLGSSLLDKPKEVWESAINKLEMIPHEDIQKVLKVSYDGLNDIEQNIFLDIACFLKWENIDFAIEFFNACGFYPNFGISVLIDKCLVTISDDNKITMHDLLQEMGWEIVRQESTKDPGERSRLWHHEDISNIFEHSTGTKAIEGICLDMSKQIETINLQPSALLLMRKLRFFKLHSSHHEENSNINKVHVSQGLNSISIELRYLCWHGCPLKSLQLNFHPRNLVGIDMPYSDIEQLWPGAQLHKLKYIDLSYSKHLRIQDLSLAPNLESLILEGCTSLFQISSSMQCLNKLVTLNLRHCKSLHSLPMGIHLESLRKAMLSCCSNLEMFPEISCNTEELFLDETAIEELSLSKENLSKLTILNLKNCLMLKSLPSSICKLKSLENLNLSGCSKLDGLPENFGNLEALKELNLTNCCIKELPKNIGHLSSLRSLLIGKNNFESVPTSIVNLSKLSHLDLSYCKSLQSLSKLPYLLQSIDAYGCTSLEALSSLAILSSIHYWQSARVNFSNCFNLVDQNAFQEFVKYALQKPYAVGMRSFISSAFLCFPGNEIPKWFILRSTRSFITLELSEFVDDLDALIMCAIVEFRSYHNTGLGLVVGFECKLTSGDEDDKVVGLCHGNLRGWDYNTGPEFVDSDHVFLGHDFPLKFSNSLDSDHKQYKFIKMTIQFYVENLKTESIDCCKVTKCGVWGPLKVNQAQGKEERKEEKSSKRLKFLIEGESSSRKSVWNLH